VTQVTVGAYVCPSGIFGVECHRRRSALHIERAFALPGHLVTAHDASVQLTRALAAAGVTHAGVAIALRGFGVVHHVLDLPPGTPDVLTAMVDRELVRLDPSLEDAVSAVVTLSSSPRAVALDAASAQLAGAVDSATVRTFERQLAESGHALRHLTALPAAMNRLAEEFDHSEDVSAFVASLPDGFFVAFFLGGAMRLAIEPPGQDAADDATALAEEVELGVTLLRQQFRGADLDRVTLVGAVDTVNDAEPALAARLGVPVSRFALRDLSAAAHAAVGAVLDAASAAPLSLGGDSGAQRQRRERWKTRPFRLAWLGAGVAALLFALWAVLKALDTRRAASDLAAERRHVQATHEPARAALVDPSGARGLATNTAVAQPGNAPTVRAANEERRLTGVLIADERRVARIDDRLVRVGDVLRDGSRVTAIQPTGVWIIDKNGTWRLLTLSRRER